MSVKITDLVDEKAIQQLKDLQVEFATTRDKYVEIAKELVNGIKINIEVVGDIDKLNELYTKKAKEASEATEKLNINIQKQNEVVANTTNTISRRLAEQEKLNKSHREALENEDRYKNIMEQINGTYEQRVKRLVQLENELKANKQAQKDLNDAIEKGTISQDKAEAKMVELVKQGRELAQSKATLNTQLKNEEREMQSVKGSYTHLSQQLELLKKAYKSLTQAEREDLFGKELESMIQDLDAHLKDLAADMGEFQRNVGNYAIANGQLADSLLDVIGLNNQFGASIKALGENSSGSFIDGLKDKVKAFGSTLSGILKNKWILSFLGIAGAGAAFKWWYDYNKGLEKATRLTQQFTGLTGDELKKTRTDIASLADAYEKDFNEVLIATNAIAKQFGISFDEAFNLVKDGFISGADANGEFLENVKEYPAYFKEAGLSASEFIAITTQANQAGIYSDKGIDVIKEANLRIREMTKSTAEAIDGIGLSSSQIQIDLAAGLKTPFQVMQEISAELAKLPEDCAEVGTAIADIFGGPGEDAGLQYLITLKDIDTNLENVKGKAGELGALQEEQLNSQMALQEAIANLFDATGGTFESFTTSVKILVNDALASLINKIAQVVDFVRENKTAFLTFGGIVASVTAIVNAHNIALALTAVRVKAVAVAKAALNTVMTLGRAILALLTAGYLACTGNIVAATMAMRAFNTAIASNPIGLLLTAISLLVTALLGLGDATDEATEAEKRHQEELKKAADREKEMAAEANRTAGAQIASYKKLQKAWNELGDDMKKKEKFVKSNQKAFKDLGWEIDNARKAEKFFNEKTADVCKAFVLRAKAAATAAAMENVWTEYLNERDQIIKDTRKMPKYKKGDSVDKAEYDRVGGAGIELREVGRQGQYVNYDYVVVDEKAYGDAHNKEQSTRRNKAVDNARALANKAMNQLQQESLDINKQLDKLYASIGIKVTSDYGGYGGNNDNNDNDNNDDNDDNDDNDKTKENIKDVNDMMLNETLKRIQAQLSAEEEGTAEWKKLKLEELNTKEEIDKRALKKNYDANLENLEKAKKAGLITEEDYTKQKQKLEEEYNATVTALAEKKKDDIAAVEEKVTKKLEEEAKKRVEAKQNKYAAEQIERDQKYSEELKQAKEAYVKELEAANGNHEKMEKAREKYEQTVFDKTKKYSEESAKAAVDMLKEILTEQNLSAEERAKIEQQLAQAEMDYEQIVADNAIENINRVTDADNKAKKKRLDNAKQWLEVASDSISAISDLANALFDNKISKIEEEQEANEEATEAEIERISQLEESKAITKEEAEARKRAAEEKSAKKNEELEKKKAELQYKQAVLQKATDLAQAAISTALGIISTIAQMGMPAAIPMIAVVSTLGAIQFLNMPKVQAIRDTLEVWLLLVMVESKRL